MCAIRESCRKHFVRDTSIFCCYSKCSSEKLVIDLLSHVWPFGIYLAEATRRANGPIGLLT